MRASRAATARQTSQIQALEADVGRQVARQQRLQGELAGYAARLATAADAGARLAALQRAHAAAEHELAQLRQDLSDRNQRLEEWNNERTSAAGERESLEEQLRLQHDRAEQLQVQVERLEQDRATALEAALAERDQLKHALAAAEAAFQSTAPTSQLQALEADVARGMAEQERLQGELAAYAARLAAAGEADERLAALQREHAAAEQSLLQLRHDLTERDLGLEKLSNELNSAAADRAALEEQLRSQQQQAENWLAEFGRIERDRAAALDAAHAERDELRAALEAVEAASRSSAPPASSDDMASEAPPAFYNDSRVEAAPAPSAWRGEWNEPTYEPETTSYAEPQSFAGAATPFSEPDRADPETQTSAKPPSDDETSPSAASLPQSLRSFIAAPIEEPAQERVDAIPLAPSRSSTPELSPGLTAEPAQPVPSSTSFIDRYRYLLEDDADAAPAPTPGSARALLDEEYLSPAQAKVGDHPDDDSDEALEAYMSNLMRRVRGDAETGPSAAMADRSASLAAGIIASSEPDAAVAAPSESEELVDLESIKRPRRHAPPLDMAALRAIANDSARTALDEHKQRRHADSVMTRSILFGLAASASAYALYAAPNVDHPWFWAGAASAFAAGGLGIRLLVLLRRRQFMMDRRLDPQAAVDEPEYAATDFDAPADAAVVEA